jgi:hypothetical protein
MAGAAMAPDAVAVGAFAIGRLNIINSQLRTVEIRNLRVQRLEVRQAHQARQRRELACAAGLVSSRPRLKQSRLTGAFGLASGQVRL